MTFSGLAVHMGNLSQLSKARTRSISPENFSGGMGRGGMSTDGPAAGYYQITYALAVPIPTLPDRDYLEAI